MGDARLVKLESECCGCWLPRPPASHRPARHRVAAAWNNLGDAYEKQKKYGEALSAYKEVLTYAPDNKV